MSSKNSLRKIFAQNIKFQRERLKISQEDLAELCDLHRTYIGSVERAERNVSIDNIEKISKGLGVCAKVMLESCETT